MSNVSPAKRSIHKSGVLRGQIDSLSGKSDVNRIWGYLGNQIDTRKTRRFQNTIKSSQESRDSFSKVANRREGSVHVQLQNPPTKAPKFHPYDIII